MCHSNNTILQVEMSLVYRISHFQGGEWNEETFLTGSPRKESCLAISVRLSSGKTGKIG